jgi:hypothetical protein
MDRTGTFSSQSGFSFSCVMAVRTDFPSSFHRPLPMDYFRGFHRSPNRHACIGFFIFFLSFLWLESQAGIWS